MFVEDRVRILYRLQKFAKYDIGFGQKGDGKRFSGFHDPVFEKFVNVEFLRC